MEETKKMKCYQRLTYKQFVQVSGFYGPQFPSYLPKRFTHLCRALYGYAILVYRFGPPIWPPEINKTSGVHFFYKSSFFSLENQPTCAQAVLDTVHVTNFVQSRHCRWRTDSFSFVRVVSSIFFAFRSLTSGLRLYFLEKFE